MKKSRWTPAEIEEWRDKKGKRGYFGYFNTQDSNIFVPRSTGFGWAPNWGNPIALVIVLAVIALIGWRVMAVRFPT